MDHDIRIAAFKWLREKGIKYDDVLPRKVLEEGFIYQDIQIHLIGAQGIWKPKVMQYPLSITTTSDGPYSDAFTSDFRFLQYSYRGKDPFHRDNVALRKMMELQIPLIYFHSVIKGKYVTAFPVYIVSDDMKALKFKVSLDEMSLFINKQNSISEFWEDQESYIRRGYLTSTIKTRIHQKAFRERILQAYKNQCTLCKLKHIELLDAAHIIADIEEEGLPLVQNGLSLCKIHHAAFDKNILGINPDYIIKIREDILIEIDGPMLKYGLQSLENQKIVLPTRTRDWPDREKLEYRYSIFRKAI